MNKHDLVKFLQSFEDDTEIKIMIHAPNQEWPDIKEANAVYLTEKGKGIIAIRAK